RSNKTHRSDDRSGDQLFPVPVPVMCTRCHIRTCGPDSRSPPTPRDRKFARTQHTTYPVSIANFRPSHLAEVVLFKQLKTLGGRQDVKQSHLPACIAASFGNSRLEWQFSWSGATGQPHGKRRDTTGSRGNAEDSILNSAFCR